MTAKYEAGVIFSVAESEEATAALKEKINDLIAKNGTIESIDDWGKRRLAYPINDETEGYYVFFNFESRARTYRKDYRRRFARYRNQKVMEVKYV